MFDFRHAVQFWRKQRGLTQAGLGELIGMSRAQVQRYESGEAAPSLEAGFLIAAAVEIPPERLFAELARRAELTVAARRRK